MSNVNREDSCQWHGLPACDSSKKKTRAAILYRKTLLAQALLASLLFTDLLFAGCQKPQPLPEQGTYAQRLYVERCGGCHRPYSPASMTAAMWEVQVEAMRAKILQAG